MKINPGKNHSTIFDNGATDPRASPGNGKRILKSSSSQGLQLYGGYGNDSKGDANVKAYSRH